MKPKSQSKRFNPAALSDQFMTDAALVLHEVWQYVGYDVQQCCEQEGEPLTNDAAIECCIDAGRPMEIVRDKERAARFTQELQRLIQIYGYKSIARHFTRRFPLV